MVGQSMGIDLIRIEPMGMDLHSSPRSNFVTSAKVNLVVLAPLLGIEVEDGIF